MRLSVFFITRGTSEYDLLLYFCDDFLEGSPIAGFVVRILGGRGGESGEIIGRSFHVSVELVKSREDVTVGKTGTAFKQGEF